MKPQKFRLLVLWLLALPMFFISRESLAGVVKQGILGQTVSVHDGIELRAKRPPFRPSLHLKGIPMKEQGARKRTAQFASVIPAASFLKKRGGFTLIELVMVILLLAVLAAVAIPNFQDFRTDARNAATKGGLGGVRSAIAIARAAIALREDVNVPIYPTALEMQNNSYNGSHPVLNALAAANKRILDGATGAPVNPWSLSTIPLRQQSSIFDCNALTRPNVRSIALQTDFGWCYKHSTGEFWANSDKNSGSIGNTENNY